MVGIKAYGAYVPIYRLSRAEITKIWGAPPAKGEKAVANYDEDAISMAVEAARDCLSGIDPRSIDAVYFASASSPYKEKLAASIIAAALDLRPDTITADFSSSLRGATIALKTAADVVKGGTAKNILVCAGECRLGPANGDLEKTLGDGAAAFIVGDTNVAVSFEDSYAIYNEALDTWRNEGELFVRAWEERFVRDAVYTDVMKAVGAGILQKTKLTAKDIAKVVAYGPDSRTQQGMMRGFGFDPAQIQDTLIDTIGNTGSALLPMMLVGALEEAKAGDKILCLGYGDGGDALVMQVTDEIGKIGNKRGIKRHVESKMVLPTYGKYIRFRKLMQMDEPRRPDAIPVSVPDMYRKREQVYRLHGSKCKRCGKEAYPVQKVCTNIDCRAHNEYDIIPFSSKTGEIVTYTQDMLFAAIDPPTTVCVVDFEGGARSSFDMTDRDPETMQVGMTVEFTFRKIYEVKGVHNYFWKIRPVRC